jgi:hypothetical protein
MSQRKFLRALTTAAAAFAATASIASPLMIYDSVAAFAAASPALSTQNFDNQTFGYGFDGSGFALGGVRYDSDAANACGGRCWVFDGAFVSQPLAVRSVVLDSKNTLSFGTDRYVQALGFWVAGGSVSSTSNLLWDVVIEEIDGTSTYLPVRNSVSGPTLQYLGFVSTVGIKNVSVRDNPADNFFAAFQFDDVARSGVLGGPELPDSIPTPPCTVNCGSVPEPDSLAMVLLAGLMMAAVLQSRRKI